MEKAVGAKEKMQKALIDLLHEKDFLGITVKELCVAAGVNRTTFYAYYENTFELLNDAKDYMIRSFFESIPKDQLPARSDTADFISEPFLVPYLRFVRANRRMYETYRDLFGDDRFPDLIREISYPTSQKAKIPTDPATVTYATRFFIGGIESIVREWIRRGFAEREEDLARLIVALKRPIPEQEK